MINEYDKGDVMEISTVSKHLLTRDFLDIYLTTFSESVIS